jgi:hypothetical protein
MELARFLSARQRERGGRERLYLGHPGCDARLCVPDWLEETERPFTLVVPPLSEPRFHRIQGCLHRLLRFGSREIELSLNDWGTLAYCSEFIRGRGLPWLLAAGILLAEQHTDPLLAEFCRPTERRTPVWSEGEPAELRWRAPPPALAEHWRMPGVFTKIDLLREMGVKRVELCAQPLPWPEQGPGLPVSIYQDALLGFIPCPSCAGERVPGCGDKPTVPAAACAVAAKLGKRGGRTLCREHNLIWYTAENPPPAWADRLVVR